MMLRFLSGIFALALVLVSVGFSTGWADQKQAVHRVKKGDSLYNIARKAHISVAELKSLNHLTSNKIKPGQRLILAEIAPPVTETTEVEATTCSPPPLSHERKSLLEKTALSFLNMPYRLGGVGKKGIDCSGFVRLVFKSFDFELPHSARKQYTLGTKVAKSDLQVGDLLFFRTYAKYPSHVGIYLGGNKMIHASYRDRGVIVSNIDCSYYRKRYIGAKRLALTQKNLGESDHVLSGEAMENSEHSAKDAGKDVNG